jgi:hypothetical protein
MSEARSQSVKKTSPRWRPRSTTRRAEGNGVAGCTRDGHGFRHRLPSPAGRVQPRGELTQRVGVQVCDIHPPSLAPPRTVSDIGYGPDRDAARADALIFVFGVPSGRSWHAGSASWPVGWWGWRLRCSNGCSRDAVDRRRDPRRGETPRGTEQRTRWTTWTRRPSVDGDRFTHNPEVAGSNPAPATSFRSSRPFPGGERAFCVPGAVARRVAAPGLRAAWRRDGGDGGETG